MDSLRLCRSCKKKNSHLAGLQVYVRRPSYSVKNSKTQYVKDLAAQGVSKTTIAQKAGICIRQIYRITGGK